MITRSSARQSLSEMPPSPPAILAGVPLAGLIVTWKLTLRSARKADSTITMYPASPGTSSPTPKSMASRGDAETVGRALVQALHRLLMQRPEIRRAGGQRRRSTALPWEIAGHGYRTQRDERGDQEIRPSADTARAVFVSWGNHAGG
ncbi:hypothetical protein [Nonomuraea sp. KM90]|uniref:hypothetical protein n=1 Tax=Nonomuraea sp. KM90 TaxID=3457428 RepID=UPI003FCC4B17